MSMELAELRSSADASREKLSAEAEALRADLATTRAELEEARRLQGEQEAAVRDAQRLVIMAAAAAEQQQQAQAALEAEVQALRASQSPSAAATAAAVEATYQLQEQLIRREKEMKGGWGCLGGAGSAWLAVMWCGGVWRMACSEGPRLLHTAASHRRL